MEIPENFLFGSVIPSEYLFVFAFFSFSYSAHWERFIR